MVFVALLVVLGAFWLYLGWRFSRVILRPEPYGLYAEFQIIDYQDGLVTLPRPSNDRQFANTLAQGQYALLWADGMGRLGDIREESALWVKRELELVFGAKPKVGEHARLDSFVFRRNPKADQGLDYEELYLEGPRAKLQCWWLAGHREKAIVLLHGRRRGQITEVQRVLPKLVAMGYSVLALSYRNHSNSGSSPDGLYHYAASEWQDALTGIRFLQDKGIKEIALYGFSMGGAVSLETLKRLTTADLAQVKALVLDAPLLDPRSVFALGLKRLRFPLVYALIDWALLIAKWRTGIDWASLDQRSFAKALNLPVLLFMGTADTTIPIDLVDDFASRVARIDYVRLEAVEHVEAWNVDPEAYESKLEAFLAEHFPVV